AVADVLRGEALAVEPVPEVRVAPGAADLGADHPVRAVLDVPDRAGQRLVEARPAAVGLELRLAGEQRRPAGAAAVRPRGDGRDVLTGPRRLGAGLPEHP